MAGLYIRGKDGRPQLVGETADPQLPGRVTALEERVDAIEAAPGGVPLSDAVDSESSTTAATSKAAKTAYDKAVAAADDAASAASAAATAQDTAEAAKTAADSAQSTATGAQSAAASAARAAQEAQEAADAAQSKADNAATAAAAAQADADAAQSTATAAQTKANSAYTEATKAASTTVVGRVKLSDAVNSAVSTTAATSKAAKTAYDKAVAATFPKGTRLLFHQAAAPTGWTKQTTINDAALRVVSGTTGGDTGGSLAFSTLFAAGKAVTLSGKVGATTLTANQGPLHDHEMAGNTGVEDPTMYRFYANFSPGAPKRGSEDNKYPFTCLSVLSSGGSTSHAHTLSGSAKIALNVKYTDVIICVKA